jgi:NADPH:quinone reductase-like Zn-dependent oxidoreductase
VQAIAPAPKPKEAERVRAVLVSEFGPPEVLAPGDVPDPVAEAGQAVIELEIANITFVETRTGSRPREGNGYGVPK